MVTNHQFREAAYRNQWLNNVRDVPALPPIVTTHSFSDALAAGFRLLNVSVANPKSGKLKSFQGQISRFAPCRYGSVRFDGKIRHMEFPHPAAYSWLVEELCRQWGPLFPRINNPHSVLAPRKRSGDSRIVRFDDSYNQIRDPFGHSFSGINSPTFARNATGFTVGDPSESFTRGKVVMLDIANFFPSVYTHALDWVITKTRGGGNTGPGSDVDKAFQISRNNRTDGISIGPVTSNVAAELILEPLDNYLDERQRLGDLLYVRAVDDITLLVSKDVNVDVLVSEIAAILRRYSLDLNHSKEKLVDYYEFSSSGIQIVVDRFLGRGEFYAGISRLPAFFADLVSLDEKNPGISVVKYAWKKRFGSCKTPAETEDFLFRSLIFAFKWPHLIPSIVDKIVGSGGGSPAIIGAYEELIYSLTYRELRMGSTETACWMLYLIRCLNLRLWRVLEKFDLDEGDCIFDEHAIEEWLSPLVALVLWSFGHRALNAGILAIYSGNVRVQDERMEDWSDCWPIRYQMYLDGFLATGKLEPLEKHAFDLMEQFNFCLL